jgi:tetratricopeptide (TPR) repeat protein
MVRFSPLLRYPLYDPSRLHRFDRLAGAMAKSKLFSLLTRDHAQIAEHHLREGRKDKAAEAFARGGDFQRAAKLAAEIGDEPQAVAYTLQGALGQIPEGYGEASAQQAGELLAVRGHHHEAMFLFELAKAWRKAAEVALKLKQFPRAARFYELSRGWAEAALYYERAKMYNDVLRVLELESKRLRQDPRARSDPSVDLRLREVDLKRAELLARLGRGGEGAALAGQLQATAKTAHLLETAGKHVEAMQAYLEMGKPDEARRLLPQVPESDRRRVAEVYARAGLHPEAAHLFAALGLPREAAEAYEAAQDWARAGSRWEAARDPQRAAHAYLRADRPRDAARCFTAAGKPQLAAAAYAKAGDREAAAASYLKAGQPLDAAHLLLALGDRPQAARALMQIQPGQAGFEEGTLLLAPLLIEERLFEEAHRRLVQVPVNERSGATQQVLERIYWEARALEGLGATLEARLRYEKVTALKPDYRDAAHRLGSLVASLSQERTAFQPSATRRDSPPGAAEEATRREVGPAPGLAVGHLLAGRYDVLAELGRGGMGKVYKAHDRELGETVAIKTLLSPQGDNPREEERLLREVQICRKITHPNVVRVFDLGRFAGGIFVTMELLEGESLEKVVSRRQELPLSRIRSMLADIAAGLREAHSLGIIHRDLKPSNVVVTPGRLKILDFGIARMLDRDTRLTQPGFAVGSPMYMSPEQLQGMAIDGRSDLYALGVLAFTLIAGVEPFQAENSAALALQHLQQPPPDIRRFRPGLPAPWIDFVARLLAKQPAQRPASAQEVLEALAALPDEPGNTTVVR